MNDTYCKKHFISYTGINPDLQLVRKCPDLSKNCPHCRIAELEARLDAVRKIVEVRSDGVAREVWEALEARDEQ